MNFTPYKHGEYPKILPVFDTVHSQLREQPAAVWKATPKQGGGYNKVPCHPETGRYLKTSEPDTWGSFEQAKAAYERGGWSGVGILLTGNGIVGFDIDKAKETFARNPEVKRWLVNAIKAGAYVEKSPSGNGYRGFVRGLLPTGCSKRGDSVEMYADVRFLTVTGHVVKLKEAA